MATGEGERSETRGVRSEEGIGWLTLIAKSETCVTAKTARRAGETACLSGWRSRKDRDNIWFWGEL
jgi:hypothetical protein